MLASLRARVSNQTDIALPVLVSSNTHLGLLRFRALLLNLTRNFAVKPSSGEEKQKFSNPLAVSFLANSCGLCPESAESASRKVKLKSLDNPNSILNLLKSYGFTQTQITKMISSLPKLLTINAQNVFLPKLEFFRSRRISSTELTYFISSYPKLLQMALDKTIIPSFNSLKNAACLDDKQVMLALKNCGRVRLLNQDSNVAPNISLLRGLGVPQSSISFLVTCHPAAVFLDHDLFAKAVEEVKEMGFDPSKLVFVVAITVVSRMTKSKWESKFKVFGRYGWSKEEVFEAFKKQPICIALGENKIARTMDFLLTKMRWPSKDIVKAPELIFFSLENRIKPRCYVIQVLKLKGLVNENLNLSIFLKLTEKQFIERYVTKFQEVVPELLSVYKGKMDPSVEISHP